MSVPSSITVSVESRAASAGAGATSRDDRGNRALSLGVLRWALGMLPVVGLAAFLGIGAAGCGGDDGGGGGRAGRSGREGAPGADDEGGGSLNEYIDAAEEYLAKAQEVGADKYFAEDFEKAESRLEKAGALRLDGNIDDAQMQYRLAANSLKSLIDRAEGVTKLLEEVSAAKTRLDGAKAKADAAEAGENAPSIYQEAMAAYNQAVLALEQKDERAIKRAQRDISRATELFGQSTDLASRNVLDKELAIAEQKAMLEIKKLAMEKEANSKALSLWQRAESEERQADNLLKRGDFQFASQSFKSAASIYVSALESVVEEQEFQAMLQKQQEQALEAQRLAAEQARLALEAQKAASQGGGAESTPTPQVGNVPPVPPPIDPLSGSGGPAIISIPCLSGVDSSAYPQAVDEEDEAFLIENLSELSSVAVYDPSNGGVLLDYSDGRKLKKEIIASAAVMGNIMFEDPMLVGQEQGSQSQLSMLGHTKGFVLFPVPFRYRVRVTWKFEIQTMTGKGSFGCLVSFDPKKKNCYETNFVHLGVAPGGRVRSWKTLPGRFQQSANYWHTKQRPVPWVVEFQMPHPEKAAEGATASGMFSAVYDLGLDEEARNEVSTDSYQRGLVGFKWSEVRFIMRSLQVCGILDKELAVQLLRAKLGVPKSAPTPKPAEEEEQEQEEPAADPEPGAGEEGGEPTPPDPGGDDFEY